MFTVEMDWDEVAITILDDNGVQEDVGVFLYDDMVYIRQWNEKNNKFEVITLAPNMWEQLVASIDSSSGAYLYTNK
jgi:hypothetical protein|tara:strand:- start:2184 stop:2411 length:228 start_codon:yes stop_codon:yes gene_type:complete